MYGKFGLISLLTLLLITLTISGYVTAMPDLISKKSDNQSFSDTSGISLGVGEMKTIGLIGGISWVSSNEYYRLMNEMVRKELGGLHSAKTLMYSVEFGEFSDEERLADEGDWGALTQTMVDAAERLDRGGADFIVICSNTMHSTVEEIQKHVDIPVLHIADATAEKVKDTGITTVGLMGTKYTMEQDFYRGILEKKHGLTVIIPNETERDYINTVIFDELCAGKIEQDSKEKFIQIIHHLEEEGAQGVILGCTEIPLLIHQEDVDLPVFDTMTIHAQAAVDFALNKTNPF
ncbi:MAG TPA: aspartate/glutamate racemase family protein [Methanospirillum sp.]|nr:aspartate/glutamate racemase family protein [Methanospirillum sp.]